ncbi:MAG: methylaspartate ammonia-lyase [Actinomycetota bacterium]|nr:methylaspartate ammonia-lyase [Actinomycetota bacterium]
MKIDSVVCAPVRAGFFFDDQAAIRAGAGHDGFAYVGEPVTPGFRAIREPGEALSVMLVLEDGSIAFGDCAAVQYSGAGGRDPLFRAARAAAVVQEVVAPALLGREAESFRGLAGQIESISVDGSALHTAIRYGVSQALLGAAAMSRRVTMAEVVAEEYRTGIPIARIPIFAQSGDDRYLNVEKMIAKEVDVLPHGLINEPRSKVGAQGEILLDYVRWVRDRVLQLRRSDSYAPVLHFDTYGTIGLVFGINPARIADYLARLAEAAAPFRLQIEHPLDAGSKERQIEEMSRLRAELANKGVPVALVVDEWCNTKEDIQDFVAARAADVIHVKMPDLGGVGNTVEALLHVRSEGLSAYCGGTCNETDRSAQVSAHIAMATGAHQVLAKPGMGVDEGLMVVGNEMARVEALIAARELIGGRS